MIENNPTKLIGDMNVDQIMSLNWNCMSMLSHISPKSAFVRDEISMRINFQNSCANCRTEEEKIDIAKIVRDTFDEKMIKKVKKYSNIKR